MNQETLDNYFRNHWKPRTETHYLTGLNLLNKIQPYETVLDVGCGTNYFKPYLGGRLLGIDPAFDEADQKVTIEEFSGGEFDVILALGSINFGGYSNIANQIAKMTLHLKPGGRIYWRQNPGRFDHNNNQQYDIEFFPWSLYYNMQFCHLYNYDIRHFQWENNSRIYCEWVKIK